MHFSQTTQILVGVKCLRDFGLLVFFVSNRNSQQENANPTSVSDAPRQFETVDANWEECQESGYGEISHFSINTVKQSHDET